MSSYILEVQRYDTSENNIPCSAKFKNSSFRRVLKFA